MNITISTYQGAAATPLTLVDEDDTLTVFDAQYYKGEWYGDGTLNWGEGDLNMFFTIVDDMCTLHVTDPNFEGSEPFITNLYIDGKMKKLTEQHIYSILHTTI